jgi:hypothetical protein
MASTPDPALNGGGAQGVTAHELFGGGAPNEPPGEPAGKPGEEAPGEPAGESGADPAWYAEVPAELGEGEKTSLRDWLKAGHVKDVAALAKIARDNQVALRASGQIKLPGEKATAEEITAFHRAIGVPEDPKGYETPHPKDAAGNVITGADGKPVALNDALLERLASVAHKHGVPKGAYEALIADYLQAEMEEMAIVDHGETAEAAAKLKEWGVHGNAKMSAINAALEALGLDRQEAVKLRHALGAGRAMDMLAKLGDGIAEDVMLTGGGKGKFGITGGQAQEEIDKLRADPQTRAKIFVKGTPERARYERLQAIVGEEADRKMAAGIQ